MVKTAKKTLSQITQQSPMVLNVATVSLFLWELSAYQHWHVYQHLCTSYMFQRWS